MINSLDVVSIMARSNTMISINPNVFFWLLDKSGWSIPEIANKIEFEETEIRKWKDIKEKIKLPLNKVEIVSKMIERPLSAFFMAEPPKDYKLPKDFRKLATSIPSESPYAKETLLAFRKASHLQEVAKDLLDNITTPAVPEVSTYTIADNPEEIAEIERKKSGITITLQTGIENPTNAYGMWRDWLGTNGIFVFHFDIPLEDARGFCLIEQNPSVIVISKKDAIRGKIFSLFHEYAHVLLRESVICNLDSENSSDKKIREIENWCNQFAGAFLLPKEEMIREFNEFDSRDKNFLKFLQEISEKYKTSRESVLVRLSFLKLIEYPYYSNIKGIIESENRERKIKEKEKRDALIAKGIEPPFKPKLPKDKSIWVDRGSNFVSLVLQNSNKGYITERDVMDILELRVDHLMKLMPA